ncbi:SGT1 family protein [Rhodotorula toruloides]|uniref:SGT1 family protein n=1 Tax=Rhodotorula toruloides TaxID=5286 RepID=A0A511KNJ5_RHOTO|nr:SGT1 family protein [Rhodotorula toruloides]
MAARPPHEAQTDSCSYQIDFPGPHDDAQVLTDHCAQILSFIASLSKGYIWHKQPFQLGVSPLSFAAPTGKTQHQWLTGKTDVTDAVDDEWFIVWLLKQVTEKWRDAAVAVEDDDGEFLLIEAADVLPSWVTPQNAANRVWIYRGELHLIPLEHKSALPFEETSMNPSFDPEEEGFLDRATALELVRDDKMVTRAAKEVEEAVWARTAGYPGKITEHHHRTLTYLPTDVALALADSPSLVAEAIAAFYEREPGTLRVVNTMSRFPPAPPIPSTSSAPDSDMTDGPSLPNTVLVPTLLTRPLYSQLVLQRFYAPKPFQKVGWMDARLGREDERRRSVGMKIACGFEMLYKLTSPQLRHSTSDDPLANFDSSDSRYRAYLKSLAEKGFFEGEVEGSEKWREKEAVAREGWIKAKYNEPTLSFAQRVDDAISRARSWSNPMHNRIANPVFLTDKQAAALEDSEEWLSLDEQGLEDILHARQGKGGGLLGDSDLEDSSDDEDNEEGMEGVEGGKQGAKSKQEKEEERKARKVAKKLEQMAGKVENFVEGRGAASGALFDDERTDGDDSDEDVDMPEMSAEERAARLEKLVAPLPPDQWGHHTQPSPTVPSTTAGGDDSSAPSTEPAASTRQPRPPKLAKEEYEGASDLDEYSSDEEGGPMAEGEEGLGGPEVEGEDGPSVLREEDVLDMGEEMDEFLQFATEALGLTEEQYARILQDRRDRGAFVPGPPKEKKVNVIPSAQSSAVRPTEPAASTSSAPPPVREPLRNPNLTDFDSLMDQMEAELAQAKSNKPQPSASARASVSSAEPKKKNAARQSDPNRIVVDSLSDSEEDDGGEPDLSAMDAELQHLLKDLQGQGEGGMDYNLVRNFLDSFQSQGGFAGPAGNLAGRLGFQLPRDA